MRNKLYHWSKISRTVICPGIAGLGVKGQFVDIHVVCRSVCKEVDEQTGAIVEREVGRRYVAFRIAAARIDGGSIEGLDALEELSVIRN